MITEVPMCLFQIQIIRWNKSIVQFRIVSLGDNIFQRRTFINEECKQKLYAGCNLLGKFFFVFHDRYVVVS